MHSVEVASLAGVGAFLRLVLRQASRNFTGEHDSPFVADTVANMAASVVAGVVSSAEVSTGWKAAVGTGLCGSLSTFSAWQVGVAVSAVTGHPFAYVMGLLVGTLLPLCACVVGADIGVSVRTKAVSQRAPLTLFSVLLLSIAALVLTAVYREEYTSTALSVLLAPLGALSRHYLARYNTDTKKRGTLAANVLGTLVAAATTTVLTRAYEWDGTHTDPRGLDDPVTWLCALVDGYCACLTTVSTWASELIALRGPSSFRQQASPIDYEHIGLGVDSNSNSNVNEAPADEASAAASWRFYSYGLGSLLLAQCVALPFAAFAY